MQVIDIAVSACFRRTLVRLKHSRSLLIGRLWLLFQTNSREVEARAFHSGLRYPKTFQTNSREVEADGINTRGHCSCDGFRRTLVRLKRPKKSESASAQTFQTNSREVEA